MVSVAIEVVNGERMRVNLPFSRERHIAVKSAGVIGCGGLNVDFLAKSLRPSAVAVDCESNKCVAGHCDIGNKCEFALDGVRHNILPCLVIFATSYIAERATSLIIGDMVSVSRPNRVNGFSCLVYFGQIEGVIVIS